MMEIDTDDIVCVAQIKEECIREEDEFPEDVIQGQSGSAVDPDKAPAVQTHHQTTAELGEDDAVVEGDQNVQANNETSKESGERGKVEVIVRGSGEEIGCANANIDETGDIVVKEEPDDILVRIIVPDEEDGGDSATEEGEPRIIGESDTGGEPPKVPRLTVIKHLTGPTQWKGPQALSSFWGGYSEATQTMARVTKPFEAAKPIVRRNPIKVTVEGANSWTGYSNAVHRMADTKRTAKMRALIANQEVAKRAAVACQRSDGSHMAVTRATMAGQRSTTATNPVPMAPNSTPSVNDEPSSNQGNLTGVPTKAKEILSNQGKQTGVPKKAKENLFVNDNRLYDAIRAAMADPLPNRKAPPEKEKTPQLYSLLTDPRLDHVIRTALSGGGAGTTMQPATIDKDGVSQPNEEEQTHVVPASVGPCYCDICGKRYRNPATLRAHKRRHGAEKPYACIDCERSFYRKSELLEHRITHTGERPFMCEECGLTFRRSNALKIHKRVHSGEEPHKCGVCGKSFGWRCQLKVHERKHTGDKPFACSFCDKSFAWKGTLEVHVVEQHTGDKQYPCGLCKKVFAHKKQLKGHRRIAHRKVYHCKVCDQFFRGHKSLCEHRKTHPVERKSFRCEFCGKEFSQEQSFRWHVNAHKGIKPFSCHLCRKTFSRADTLSQHKMVHSREKPYLCDVCGQGFKSKASRNTHRRGHTGEGLHHCEQCGRGFTQAHRLKRHMVWHSDNLPHVCPHCGKGYRQVYGLKNHIRLVHVKERPFQCDQCEKAFFNRHKLELHARVHSGERPFVCEVCGNAFSQIGNLKVHMKVHRGQTALAPATVD